MFKTLDELYRAIIDEDPAVCDAHGQWRTDLPTFGGEVPTLTLGVWSWDQDRVIVGTSIGDLQIMGRAEWLSTQIEELLDYWKSPFNGATGNDAVSDGHTPEHRAKAVDLIRQGGPWDEDVLYIRPAGFPVSWEPIEEG